jgi:ABC-2 type transport system permease protein
VAVIRSAAHLSLGDFFGTYPPRLYFIAWIPRTLFQLAFFALVARFLGGPDFLSYVVVGTVAHSVYIGALLFTVSSVGREQDAGTIPLLVAAPAQPVLVFLGRAAANFGNGLITSALTFALATVVLDLRLAPAQVASAVGILALMSVGVCGLGLVLGSVALRVDQHRNTIGNGAAIALTFLTGAYVPVEWLPGAIRPLSEVLPVTHGLRALRALTLGAPADVPLELILEAGVGALGFALAAVSFAYFLRDARARGTLDFH